MDLGTSKMIARKESGIGWMIFNQPEKHNAVSYAMWLAIPGIIADFEADPAVRVIVLAGAGDKAFVSGADISEFEEKRGSEEAVKTHNAAGDHASEVIAAATKPTIAVIRGLCVGGGVALALTAEDARVMGLVNRVVPRTEVEDFVRSYAAKIVDNAPLTIRAAKMAANAAASDESKRDLAAIEAMVASCFASEDYIEGRRAFMEKRKPRFQGR